MPFCLRHQPTKKPTFPQRLVPCLFFASFQVKLGFQFFVWGEKKQQQKSPKEEGIHLGGDFFRKVSHIFFKVSQVK